MQTLVDTVLFRIDPLTGASVSPAEENTERLLEGTDVIAGPLTEAFLLPGSDVIILIDEYFQVHPAIPGALYFLNLFYDLG
jgi:MoxR-like ATPase